MKRVRSGELEAKKFPDQFKPYSAGMVETEFSHLVDAIARANNLLQATVYNLFGLAVAGGTGPIFLDKNRLDDLKKCTGGEAHTLTSYCRKTKTSKDCSRPMLKTNEDCVDKMVQSCKRPVFTVYRCILDHKTQPYKKHVVGYSAVTFNQALFSK